MDKFDLILQEIRNINSKFEQIDKRFEQIENRLDAMDKRFEQIENRLDAMDKRFEQIENRLDAMDKRFEQIENRLDAMDKRFEQIDNRLDAMDTRITSLKADNLEAHDKIYLLLNSLNTSFLRFEAEFNDKVKILFDGYADLQAYKNITSHEITNINNKISNLTFRVSKLENS